MKNGTKQPSVFGEQLTPLSEDFTDLFLSYIDTISAAIKANKHHDQRRALFIDFFRKSFSIDVDEVELEHKIKVASVRGRIDAFYRFVIFEFKTDLERERHDAMSELTKYFEAQSSPEDYVAAVTDGLVFEVYDFDSAKRTPLLVRTFELESARPEDAFREIDELIAIHKKVPPKSEEIVARFGSRSLAFNRSISMLDLMYTEVKGERAVKTKFREWNALLAKVYGSALGNVNLFLTHTY